ncbi:MAG TPA: hypothetical protein VE397_10255, partial [Stellaceae bacterium]|nr:hypothetical protein [Stellaceae bacterium]
TAEEYFASIFDPGGVISIQGRRIIGRITQNICENVQPNSATGRYPPPIRKRHRTFLHWQ